MMKRSQIINVTILLGLAVLASCTTGAGEGRVWGSLYLPTCNVETDDYDMEVDFFAADYFENTLTIRLQRSGDEAFFTDGIILQIRDVEEIADSPPDRVYEIKVEPTLEDFEANGPDAGLPQTTLGSPGRVTLYLNETCPGNTLAFTDGAGQFQMEHIYVPGKNKRIKGSFNFEFVDPRHWNSPDDIGPFASIEGEFDFNYSSGKSAQTFP